MKPKPCELMLSKLSVQSTPEQPDLFNETMSFAKQMPQQYEIAAVDENDHSGRQEQHGQADGEAEQGATVQPATPSMAQENGETASPVASCLRRAPVAIMSLSQGKARPKNPSTTRVKKARVNSAR